jgi:hypothetical protein
MSGKKTSDLGRIKITNNSLTSSPVVTVTIFRNEVPPKTHLLHQRGTHFIENVLSSRKFRRVPDVSSILIRVTIKPSGGWRVVGVDCTICELDCCSIEQSIEEWSVFRDTELVTNARDARGNTEIVVRQIDYAVCARVIKSFRVQKRKPGLLFLGGQAHPQRICG